MYQNCCLCYLYLYMACFLTNCLQNTRNAALDNPLFQNFWGKIPPDPPMGLHQTHSYAPPPPPPNPQQKSWLRAWEVIFLRCWELCPPLLITPPPPPPHKPPHGRTLGSMHFNWNSKGGGKGFEGKKLKQRYIFWNNILQNKVVKSINVSHGIDATFFHTSELSSAPI